MPYKKMIEDLQDKSSLSLKNKNIGDEDVKPLFQALKDTQITSLDLSGNNIGNEGIKSLCQVLKDTQITCLDLSKNNIRKEGVKFLSQVLEETKITEINLSGNKIGTDSAEYVNQILNRTKVRLNLDVHYTEVYGVNYMSQKSYCNDIHITFHGNKIGTNGATYLNKIFQNIPIADLELDSMNLEEDDAQYLAQAFNGIKIMDFSVWYNHLMQENGVRYLTQAFRDSQIARLTVHAHKIGPTGAKYLAEFLKEIKIIELNLNSHYIKDEGVKYLAAALKTNTVMHLDLSCNDIGADGAKHLSEILRDTQIIFINLCHDFIGVDGAKYLADGLKYSQVTGIHLHGNNILYEGYQYLKDVVDDTNLNWVNLHWNGIEKGLEKGTKFWPYCIPRNSYSTVAFNLRSAFGLLVSLNPVLNDFEFIVPARSTVDVNQYFFIIKTLTNDPNSKAHIFKSVSRNNGTLFDFDSMKKINEFIKSISTKFNTFINSELPALLEVSGDYNYVDLVKQFEGLEMFDIVQNLLLHRGLYYIDDNQEILHPYIYKMLQKYDIILYNAEIEPNKKEKIVSYYQNNSEIDGVQEIIDLLESKSF